MSSSNSLAVSAERKRHAPRPFVVTAERKMQDYEAIRTVCGVKVACGSTKNAPYSPKRHTTSSCQTCLQHIRDGRAGRPAWIKNRESKASALVRGNNLGSAQGPGGKRQEVQLTRTGRHQYRAATLARRGDRERATSDLTDRDHALTAPRSSAVGIGCIQKKWPGKVASAGGQAGGARRD